MKKANNHWPRAQFESRAPGIDWGAFFAAAGLDAPARVRGLAAGRGDRASPPSWRAEPLDAWKDYLAFHAIEH